MKKELKYFLLGVLATFTGTLVAQTPTIFSSIRVNGQSDLRGSVLDGTGNLVLGDTTEVTGPLLISDGTSAAPALAFASDTNSGIWNDGGSDELFIGVDGGSANSGGISLFSTSGNISGDTIGVTAGSGGVIFDVTGGIVTSNATIRTDVSFENTANGAVGGATYTWDGDENTGLYRVGADQLGITAGGTQRALFDSAGATLSAIVSSGALTFNGVVTTDNTTADEVGYKGVPQNSQSGNYTLVLTDSARHIYHPSGGGAGDTFTIPANGSVAYPVGTVVTFINDDSNAISIAITTDTMTQAGTTNTGTRTLGENGIATAIKVTSTSWIINGTGLT